MILLEKIIQKVGGKVKIHPRNVSNNAMKGLTCVPDSGFPAVKKYLSIIQHTSGVLVTEVLLFLNYNAENLSY